MYRQSGQQQQQAAIEEANYVSRESAFSYEQGLREAAQTAYEGHKFKENQALQFASSGVTLQGSPLGVLQETQSLVDQEVAAQKRRATEMSKLYEMQGLQLLRQGSNAAFNGFTQGLQSEFESKVRAYQQRQQGFQSALSGAGALASGIGSLFGGGGGGGGFGGMFGGGGGGGTGSFLGGSFP